MDIGAGYCEFLNTIHARKKIAVDVNPDTKKRAAPGILVILSTAERIPKRYDGTIDKIFMSNVLEHLSTKEHVLEVLTRAYKLLKSNGKIIILQPNINLVKEHYWDFFDHYVPLNGKSMQEVLDLCGFKLEVYIERFLPYTTKTTAFIQHPLFIQLYLLLPSALRPYAGQSFFIGRK